MRTHAPRIGPSMPVPPDANGPSAARSCREPEGTGLLCVTALVTRGCLHPFALQQLIHMHTLAERLLLASVAKCAASGQVWQAQVAGERPLVAEARGSGGFESKLGCCDHLGGCSAAAAPYPRETKVESARKKNTCRCETKGMSEKE